MAITWLTATKVQRLQHLICVLSLHTIAGFLSDSLWFPILHGKDDICHIMQLLVHAIAMLSEVSIFSLAQSSSPAM